MKILKMKEEQKTKMEKGTSKENGGNRWTKYMDNTKEKKEKNDICHFFSG